MKRALLIAFHHPPCTGTSGVQRATRFAQYLPEFGWQPEVLTATPGAYERTSTADDTPTSYPVHRALALDAARHLSIRGRYPAFIARPDRWASWLLFAIPKGLQAIRQKRPDALWSTYPIPTAHLVAHALHRLTGIPWVADFRDPMAHEGYPADPKLWRAFERVEQRVFSRASIATFTTPGARQLYKERYRWQDDRLDVIENGFDEGLFEQARHLVAGFEAPNDQRILLHSGVVYPEWRNPRALFRALRSLIEAGHPGAPQIRIRFRAPAHDAFIQELARAENVIDQVETLPPIPHSLAVAEMLAAQGLLLLQSAGCNDQVPAKIYEYLRTGHPIIALADAAGDTARVLAQHGQQLVASIDSEEETREALLRWLDQRPRHPTDVEEIDAPYSRRRCTERLTKVLDKALLMNARLRAH